MVKAILTFILSLGLHSGLFADEKPALIEQILVININARVNNIEDEQLWSMEHQTLTISGRPVEINLEGANVVILCRLTPYLKNEDQVLLFVQGEIFINNNDGIQQRYSDMDSVIVKLGEKAIFFPLGITASSTDTDFMLSIAIDVNLFTNDHEG